MKRGKKYWKEVGKRMLFFALVVLIFGGFISESVAYASSSSYDFLVSGSGNDSIEAVTDVVEGLGNSGYKLARTIGIAAMIICLVVAFMMIGINKNSTKREENKSWLFYLFLGILGISGVFTLFGFFSGFFS